MPSYRFSLRLGKDHCLDYYRGVLQHVVVTADTGQSVQFPVRHLQRFITPNGVFGRFELVCDDEHRCLELRRLDPADSGE